MTLLEKHSLSYTKQDKVFVFKCKDTGVEYHHMTFAPAFARAEINKKIASESDDVIYSYAGMRKRGFCEFGIKDFCKKLKIPFSKTRVYSKEQFHAMCNAKQLGLLAAFERYSYELKAILDFDLMKWNEDEIAKDAELSFCYAERILQGRFEAGEEVIATDARYSYWYACGALKGRFEAGEAAIATDACYSYWYACGVLKGRFEAGEAAIATDARYSYWYACGALKGRFEAGEAAIATDARYSYWYACGALKGRFEAGEAAIAKHPYLNFAYQRFLKSKSFFEKMQEQCK